MAAPSLPSDLSATRRQLLGGLGAGFIALGGCASTQARADQPARFDWGVASGDPKADAIVLWTRAVPMDEASDVRVRFELARDDAFTEIVRAGVVETHAARDFTVKVDVRGLEPGARYVYRFMAGDQVSSVGRTRTLPEGDAPVRLALASCANYPSGFYNAYREIANTPDLDAVVHVGDYIYEYGQDEYDGATGRRLGRLVAPPHEILTLADYRERFACYRADEDLQAAHAAAAFITIWDDHETANNSWTGGSNNHDEGAEGRWLDRRDAALQAYFEWMPMRDPEPGQPRERLNRVYDFGAVGTLLVIETRLTGRSEQLSWSHDMPLTDSGEWDVERFETEVLADPSRSMMGPEQEAWLEEAMTRSKARGVTWQILANQTVMARMRTPDFTQALPASLVEAAFENGGYVASWLERSRLHLPAGLDSWDGYPAARRRLYDSARRAGSDLVVLSGDSHMFWANDLHHPADEGQVAVEFGAAGITSPSGYGYLDDGTGVVYDVAEREMAAFNPDVSFANVRDHGYVLITAGRDAMTAEYFKVSTIESREYQAERFLMVRTRPGQGAGPSALERLD